MRFNIFPENIWRMEANLNQRARRFSRLPILLMILALTLVITVVSEIMIDRLLNQPRSDFHLLVHSMGSIGVLMAILSLAGYVIKKNWSAFPLMQKDWLDAHQVLAVLGVVFILLHTRFYFRSSIASFTFLYYLLCVVSGFAGRIIFTTVKNRIRKSRDELTGKEISEDEVEDKRVVDTALSDTMAKWRKVHRTLTMILVVFLVLHIVSSLYFGG